MIVGFMFKDKNVISFSDEKTVSISKHKRLARIFVASKQWRRPCSRPVQEYVATTVI